MTLTVVDHPLARHYLTQLRDKATEPAQFRAITRRLTFILALEATRSLALAPSPIVTPLEPMTGDQIADRLVAVPILRAGLGMLDAVVDLFPDVSVGYIGLERDHTTAVASSYYAKLPPSLDGRTALVLDPMLATGGSAASALAKVKEAGCRRVAMVCIVAAPEGVAFVSREHPGVPIVAAGLDRQLNASKYILPGLGDFGDRLYGT